MEFTEEVDMPPPAPPTTPDIIQPKDIEEYEDILITLHTAPWCDACQKKELKDTIQKIQKSFVFGIFSWNRENYNERENVPKGMKLPNIEISRKSTGNVIVHLVGSTEIIQGLEMALDEWVD